MSNKIGMKITNEKNMYMNGYILEMNIGNPKAQNPKYNFCIMTTNAIIVKTLVSENTK